MKTKNLSLLFLTVAILATFAAGTGYSQTTIINDTFTSTGTNTGFALGDGVNFGINPPTTRLTGIAAPNLRYLQTITTRTPSLYDISANRLRVATENPATIGRFTISGNGTTPFDFGPVLGATYANSTNAATYDVKITMRNNAANTSRFSFALGTAEGDATTWDFGVQLYRAVNTQDFYTIQKRVDSASAGVTDINAAMGTTAPGTWVSGSQALISFLIRVTDAGAETSTYSSRVQVSIDNGSTWIYDTSTDAALPNGFRFDGAGRYIMFDQAGNTSGAVFYDNFSIVSTYAPAAPPQRIWSGLGGDDNWSTGDNWAGLAPDGGNPLVFNGTTRQANNNDIADLFISAITFNNGGFTLGGAPYAVSSAITNLAGNNTLLGNFSWTNASPKTWSIASGTELLLTNTTTVEVGGDHTLSGGGTLRMKGAFNVGVATTANPAFIVTEGQHIVDGGTFNSRGGYRIGSLATGTGAKTILTNAVFNLSVAGANLRVGDSANPVTSSLLINNSTLTMTGGSIGIPYAAGATGEVAQVGGVVSGAALNFNQAGLGRGTYGVTNGTLDVRQITKTTAGGASRIYFNNAVLRTSSGASNAFFSGLNTAEIQSGGLIVDAQSDVTIAQVLSGAGSLVKSNFATVTLTGANTYAGNTIVQSGKLVLPTVQTNATTVQIADGAELGVIATTATSSLSVSAVNFVGTSFATLSFDLGSFSTPSAPLMKTTSLSVSSPVVINVANGLQLTTGQIVLVDYSGSITGGFQFTIGSLPPGVTATLVNNTANSSIDLNITGVPGYRWTGASGSDWDYGTANWFDKQTASASTYSDGYPIEFLDGASTGIINISIFPNPTIMTVSNNTLPYVMNGGFITTPTLKKFGTNSLTRSGGEADTIIGIELNAGAFIATNFFDATFATILTDIAGGTGTFVKQGASTMTVTSTNSTYDGSVLIQDGILKMGGDRALGSANAKVTIANGATLDLNDQAPGAELITVSGAGVNGQGAIIDSTTPGAVDTNLRNVVLAGDTTFGVPNGGRWDLRIRTSSGAGPGLQGNGFKLTKVGSGTVSIASQRNLGTNTQYWQMNLGDILVSEGSLAFAESLSLGNPSATITLNAGTSIQFYDLGFTNPILRNIIMTTANLNCGGASTDTNVLNGTINLTGANNIKPDQATLIINGAISGSGSLNISANDPGRVYLNGINTYPGVTTVTNGLLGGTGVIAGNLVILGGTNAPGMMGVGTLTVNGSATLAGTTLMELNRNLTQNSDRLSVGGALNFAGTLQVVLATGAASPQAGDVYRLFNKAGTGTFTSIILPNLTGLPGGLAWDTTKLSVDGTITVTGAATPPTIGSASSNGSNFTFSGTGGIQGNTYYVLSSTNIAAPISSWTPVATNVFGTGGTFSFTNSINPAAPATFFLLQVP